MWKVGVGSMEGNVNVVDPKLNNGLNFPERRVENTRVVRGSDGNKCKLGIVKWVMISSLHLFFFIV